MQYVHNVNHEYTCPFVGCSRLYHKKNVSKQHIVRHHSSSNNSSENSNTDALLNNSELNSDRNQVRQLIYCRRYGNQGNKTNC